MTTFKEVRLQMIYNQRKEYEKKTKADAFEKEEEYDFSANTWKSNLKFLLSKNFAPGTHATLKQIQDKTSTKLETIYVDNKTINASIRRNLQVLRDDGYIKFIDNKGNYLICE